jgi:hypothetical protein
MGIDRLFLYVISTYNNILTAVRAHALLMGYARHFGNCGLAYLARTRTRPIVGRAAHINNARGDDVFIIIFIIIFFFSTIALLLYWRWRPLKFAENGRRRIGKSRARA